MRRLPVVFSLLVLIPLAVLAATTRPATQPATRPTDVRFEGIAGGEDFLLSEHDDEYVALHFLLKTECPICLRHTHEHHRGAGEVDDLTQVFIKPDTEREILEWLGETPGDQDVPTIHRDPDARMAKALGIPDGYRFHGEIVHYPALVLYAPGGEEIFRYVGEDNSDRVSFDKLAAEIAAHRGGSETRPATGPATSPATRPAR